MPSEGGNRMENPHDQYLELRRKYLRPLEKRENRFNDWLAIKITGVVGTMWCAYAFAGLALISLPQAIHGGTASPISSFARTILPLVLPPFIMGGQNNAAGEAGCQRGPTYKDRQGRLKN